jgi:hypothetical protein
MFDTINDTFDKAGSTATKTLDLLENTLDIINAELIEIKKTQSIRQAVLDDNEIKTQIKENMKLELQLKINRKKARMQKYASKYE